MSAGNATRCGRADFRQQATVQVRGAEAPQTLLEGSQNFPPEGAERRPCTKSQTRVSGVLHPLLYLALRMPTSHPRHRNPGVLSTAGMKVLEGKCSGRVASGEAQWASGEWPMASGEESETAAPAHIRCSHARAKVPSNLRRFPGMPVAPQRNWHIRGLYRWRHGQMVELGRNTQSNRERPRIIRALTQRECPGNRTIPIRHSPLATRPLVGSAVGEWRMANGEWGRIGNCCTRPHSLLSRSREGSKQFAPVPRNAGCATAQLAYPGPLSVEAWPNGRAGTQHAIEPRKTPDHSRADAARMSGEPHYPHSPLAIRHSPTSLHPDPRPLFPPGGGIG